MSSKLDLKLLTKKRKVEKPSPSAASNPQDGERKKHLLQKLAQKYNKKDIDPENEPEFEDQDEKAKMDYDDFEDGNRISMLRSLDESLTKGAYKGHTVRKEDLFDDVDDMSALKDEDYLAEIKKLKQIDSDEEGDDDEVDEEDEIMGQIKDIVEEDLYDSTDLETLKKTQQLEKQKAKSVLNQKLLYDHLLKLRILLQKPLSICNRLPQTEMFWDFVEMTDDILPKTDKPQAAVEKEADEETTPAEPENIPTRIAELRKDTFHLIADMLSLQSSLFKKGMIEEKTIDGHYLQNVVSTEEGDLTEKVWKVLDESYKNYETFRTESVDRWATKTKIQSTVGGSKLNLKNINAGVIDQVRNVLKNDKERKKLIGRTQVKQFEPSILGKRERDTQVDENGFEFDTEIFDDKDFYQVLLKDLISEVGSGTEVSFRKAITKKNTKGKYDGKTKGKAIKYTVHNELVNFMAPNIDNEIPESAQTLFGNLFGGGTVEFEEEEETVDDATTTVSENQDEDNESSSASSDEE